MARFAAERDPRLINCWEFTGCGREPGGDRADDLGVCPAAADRRFDGINDGINGGRACWIIAGTFSGDRPECILASAFHPCPKCDFYRLVHSAAPVTSDQEIAARFRMPATGETYCLKN